MVAAKEQEGSLSHRGGGGAIHTAARGPETSDGGGGRQRGQGWSGGWAWAQLDRSPSNPRTHGKGTLTVILHGWETEARREQELAQEALSEAEAGSRPRSLSCQGLCWPHPTGPPPSDQTVRLQLKPFRGVTPQLCAQRPVREGQPKHQQEPPAGRHSPRTPLCGTRRGGAESTGHRERGQGHTTTSLVTAPPVRPRAQSTFPLREGGRRALGAQ